MPELCGNRERPDREQVDVRAGSERARAPEAARVRLAMVDVMVGDDKHDGIR